MTPPHHRFQSLSGFQVRCNSRPPGILELLQLRFNPYRVFKFVATPLYGLVYAADPLFQSLSGFQVRCNSMCPGIMMPRWASFNPYRVFKFVATLSPGHRSLACRRSFNPYRVFKFVATGCRSKQREAS